MSENRGGRSPTVLIAAGGTGGHIYPALSIAREISKQGIKVHFVGSTYGLEGKVVPQSGYPLHLLPVGRLHGSVPTLERVKTLFLLPICFFLSLVILLRLRPIAVLGFGGFASGPSVFVAALLGFRTAIWEPNVMPGLANRLLSPFVKMIFLVFKDARHHLKCSKIVESGMPVREEMRPGREGRSKNEFHILVFGGSQGARGINEVVVKAVKEGGKWLDGVKIVHQTGVKDYDVVRTSYENREYVEAKVYIEDMLTRYHWADLVICRAGASTLAELAACQKGSVLVPLPTSADDHQLKNAQSLQRAGAAHLVEQKDFTVDVFKELIDKYKSHPELIVSMEKKVKSFYHKEAAAEIVRRLLEGVS